MRRLAPLSGVVLLLVGVLLAGCRPQQPFYFHERSDLSHYIGMATNIDYPDVESQTLSEVDGAVRPFSLANSEPKEIWELKLEDAVRFALENSKVMRQIGATPLFLRADNIPDAIVRTAGQGIPTIYDPAIIQSDPFGGVEAALSAFDAQFKLAGGLLAAPSSGFSGGDATQILKRDEPVNIRPIFGGQVLQEDVVDSVAEVYKRTATGGLVGVGHRVIYTDIPPTSSNGASRMYESDWTTTFLLHFEQPLLQGGGVAFNRIAGPGASPGINRGVLIARINTDIQLTEFEAGVRNLVNDVEAQYWELYFAYRSLDALVAGRNGALQTWRKIYALYKVGAKGGEASQEAQAREQYFLFRSNVEQALTTLYAAEANLRYIMGLAPTDGRLIRPADEPTSAKITFDWCTTVSESLCRSVEIRQVKWRVKQRELELIAAKNYLLPKLNFVAEHKWQGLGDNLLDGNSDFRQIDSGAYQSMLTGDFQNTNLGLTLDVPIGFRLGLSTVRNAQLKLARERAILQEIELEASHQMAWAIRDLEQHIVLTQTNFNRRVAAQRNVEAVTAAYETGTITLDVLLQAQRFLAQAESDYFRSLVNYNKAIAQVHYRKGSLLEYNGVYLAEGPWPGKAYFDARRRARARDAALYLDYGFTMPKVLSRGPYEQHAGRRPAGDTTDVAPGPDTDPSAEVVPAPAPIPDAKASPSGPAASEPTPEPTPESAPEPKASPSRACGAARADDARGRVSRRKGLRRWLAIEQGAGPGTEDLETGGLDTGEPEVGQPRGARPQSAGSQGFGQACRRAGRVEINQAGGTLGIP